MKKCVQSAIYYPKYCVLFRERNVATKGFFLVKPLIFLGYLVILITTIYLI
jgi:hypothetical protein